MLSQAQYDSKLASQSALARKVLNAVPASERWCRTQIRNEVFRMTHSGIEGRTVDGCLKGLIEAGLVREHHTSPLTYSQIRPHEKKPCAASAEDVAQPVAVVHGWPGKEASPPIAAQVMTSAEKPPIVAPEVIAHLQDAERKGQQATFTLIEEPDMFARLDSLAERLLEAATELEAIRKETRAKFDESQAKLEEALAKGAKLDELTQLLDSLRN